MLLKQLKGEASVLWQKLKCIDIRSANKDLPVVIPLGSMEQHGHQLPLGTDTLQVSSIADEIEESLQPEVLVLPVLWLGSSQHHLAFPGTLSVRPSLDSTMVIELAECTLRAGFQQLSLLNGHGGNEVPTAQAPVELTATSALADDKLIAFESWWAVGTPDVSQVGMATPAISHACEFETSLMLMLRPDVVEHHLAKDVAVPIESEWLVGSKRVQPFRRIDPVAGSGDLGQPTVASPLKGQSLYDAVVQDVVAFLRVLATWALPGRLLSNKVGI